MPPGGSASSGLAAPIHAPPNYIGGYPFRIEWRCGGFGLELAGDPPLSLKVPLVAAIAQIYDPRLVIAEFTGPLEMGAPGQPPSQLGNWQLGQASLRGTSSALERTSLVVEGPSLRERGAAGDDVLFRAKRIELHSRPAANSSQDNPAFDAVLRLAGAVAPHIHAVTTKPIDAEISAMMRGFPDLSPKPWPARLRDWQERGGQLEISKARLQQDDVVAVGSGLLKLTSRGNLDGNLQVTVVGLDKLLKIFEVDRMLSEGQMGSTLGALDRLIPGLGDIARQTFPGWWHRSGSGPSWKTSRRSRSCCASSTARSFSARCRSAAGPVVLTGTGLRCARWSCGEI